MGSDQSTSNRQQKDDQFPSYWIRTPPKSQDAARQQAQSLSGQQQPQQDPLVQQGGSPKHNIVVVADGTVVVKDPDPELTRLHTIPTFLPLLQTSLQPSLQLSPTVASGQMCETLDHRKLLRMCLRYQQHIQQLAEAVTFDQNALCVYIKEVSHGLQLQQSRLSDQQKKYQKYVEQFQRVTEMTTALNKVKATMDDIVPRLDHLNYLLPAADQLEPCVVRPSAHSIQAD